jgi:hypothetical protein
MKIGDLVDIKEFFTLDTPMTQRFGGCYGYITELLPDNRYKIVYYRVFLFDRQCEYLFKEFELETIKEKK